MARGRNQSGFRIPTTGRHAEIPDTVPATMRVNVDGLTPDVDYVQGETSPRTVLSRIRAFFKPKLARHELIRSSWVSMDAKPRDLEPGVYVLPPVFDYTKMHHPYKVVRSADYMFLVDLVDGSIHHWPVSVEPISSNRNHLPMSYSSSLRTLTIGYATKSEHMALGIVPQMNVFQCPTNPNCTILTWVIRNRRYLKIASCDGYVSLPETAFLHVYNRFNASSVVAPNSIQSKIRSEEGIAAEDVDTITRALHNLLGGGEKGARQFNYFVRDMFIESEMEEAVPNDNQDHVSSSGPSVITWPAVAPAKSTGCDADAIQSRLYDVNPQITELPRQILEYFAEIREFIVDEVLEGELLEPLTYDEILERQNSAKTRQKMAGAIAMDLTAEDGVNPVVQAFVKNELYSAPKKCRNISAMDPLHNLHGFAFDIPFKEKVLKRIAA